MKINTSSSGKNLCNKKNSSLVINIKDVDKKETNLDLDTTASETSTTESVHDETEFKLTQDEEKRIEPLLLNFQSRTVVGLLFALASAFMIDMTKLDAIKLLPDSIIFTIGIGSSEQREQETEVSLQRKVCMAFIMQLFVTSAIFNFNILVSSFGIRNLFQSVKLLMYWMKCLILLTLAHILMVLYVAGVGYEEQINDEETSSIFMNAAVILVPACMSLTQQFVELFKIMKISRERNLNTDSCKLHRRTIHRHAVALVNFAFIFMLLRIILTPSSVFSCDSYTICSLLTLPGAAYYVSMGVLLFTFFALCTPAKLAFNSLCKMNRTMNSLISFWMIISVIMMVTIYSHIVFFYLIVLAVFSYEESYIYKKGSKDTKSGAVKRTRAAMVV